MIKIIKLDQSLDSYIYRKSTGNKESKLDYNDNDLVIHINAKDLGEFEIEAKDICKQYNGLYYYNFNQEIKLLLDDGYYDTLSRCGYLIFDRYDINEEHSKEECLQILKKIQSDVSDSIINFTDKYLPEDMYIVNSTDSSISIEDDMYIYSISLQSVSDIITENQTRKLNDLPFIPYQKTADKYSEMYLKAFIKLKSTVKDEKEELLDKGISKYTICDELLKNFIIAMNEMDEYHFEPMVLKKMIIRQEER